MSTQKLAFEWAPPESLQKNDWNTNVVAPSNESKLDNSIDRLGMFKPIVIRVLADGTRQILGGEHRVEAAIRKGMTQVPIVNLGAIDDKRAKEISLVDNGRYGADDTLQLAELLDSLGEHDDLASFLPYSDGELDSIFSSTSIDLSELEIDDDEQRPSAPEPTPPKTHQTMRFRVPIADGHIVSELIEQVCDEQGFNQEDSLTNAGDALVWLCKQWKGK